MSYIDNNLMKDEQIIYRASTHWVVYLRTGITCAILHGYIIILYMSDFLHSLSMSGYIFVGFFVSIYATALLGLQYYIINNSEYVVTNKRLILKRGTIITKSVESILATCQGVSIKQSILGRALGYGTLIVTTGGVTSKFPYIADPVIFRNHINAQIDEAQTRKQTI